MKVTSDEKTVVEFTITMSAKNARHLQDILEYIVCTVNPRQDMEQVKFANRLLKKINNSMPD